ncbi:MAG: hypothetical protein ACI9HI_001127, partial [Salinirussus sp.]
EERVPKGGTVVESAIATVEELDQTTAAEPVSGRGPTPNPDSDPDP